MDGILRVAIVGGGDTARQLITDFLSRPFIKIVGVAAPVPDGPVARAANMASIPFTTDVSTLSELRPRPDLVVSVGNAQGMAEELEATFPAGSAGSPTVVHDVPFVDVEPVSVVPLRSTFT